MLASLLLISLVQLAVQQTSTSATDREAIAKSLFENGSRAYQDGRYEAAISAFEQAYQLAPRAPVALRACR